MSPLRIIFTPLLAATTSVAAQSTAPLQVSLKATSQCVVLNNSECRGLGGSIRIARSSGSVTPYIELGSFNDHFKNTPFDRTWADETYGHANLRLGTKLGLRGMILATGIEGRVTSNVNLGMSIYVAKVEGSIGANASLNGVFNVPREIPAMSWDGRDYPAYPLPEFEPVEFKAGKGWSMSKGAYTLGLKQHANWQSPLTRHFGLLAGQSSSVSIDTATAALCSGVVYSPGRILQDQYARGDSCNGSIPFKSTSALFSLGVETRRIFADRLFDAKQRRAESYAARVNGYINEGADRIKQEDATALNDADIPRMLPRHFLDFFGIENPYQKNFMSAVVGLRWDFGATSVNASARVPVGSARRESPSLTLLLRRDF